MILKIARALLTITAVGFNIIPTLALAKDFGTMGHGFQIKEEGFLTMIKRRGSLIDIEEENKKVQARVRRTVEEPEAVLGIKRTVKEQSFTYDPTYTLDEDAFLPDGTLLYGAGTTVNPFDHISYDKQLVFIDSSDREQVNWLKKSLTSKEVKPDDKLILVKGRPFDLEDELDVHVYFDQSGVLVEKFNIEQVPAIVCQEGKLMRVREIKI